jgi:hypothetical protein
MTMCASRHSIKASKTSGNCPTLVIRHPQANRHQFISISSVVWIALPIFLSLVYD